MQGFFSTPVRKCRLVTAVQPCIGCCGLCEHSNQESMEQQPGVYRGRRRGPAGWGDLRQIICRQWDLGFGSFASLFFWTVYRSQLCCYALLSFYTFHITAWLPLWMMIYPRQLYCFLEHKHLSFYELCICLIWTFFPQSLLSYSSISSHLSSFRNNLVSSSAI